MSKYIITKDLNHYVFNDNVNVEKYVNIKNNILKQADSIEGLLDCIVFTEKSVYNGQERKCIMYKPFVIEEDNIFETTIDTKGAIWTDKGLIYVAEMKGILPNGEIDWKLL